MPMTSSTMISSTMITAGMLMIAPGRRWRTGAAPIQYRELHPCDSEEPLHVARSSAIATVIDADRVFEDQIPANQPRDELAHRWHRRRCTRCRRSGPSTRTRRSTSAANTHAEPRHQECQREHDGRRSGLIGRCRSCQHEDARPMMAPTPAPQCQAPRRAPERPATSSTSATSCRST